MSMPNDLRPITEVVEEIRRQVFVDIHDYAMQIKKNAEERIRSIEINRQAAAVLDAVGVEFHINSRGTLITIELGFISKAGVNKLTRRLRTIREALGCRLEQSSKDVSNSKLKRVEFTLTPKDYPDIRIRFQRKLPPHAKCKIVRHVSRYSSLVCEF